MTTTLASKISWHTPVQYLKGVGAKLADTLAKAHIVTIGDLLLHCPFKYQDRTHITPICDLREGDHVVIQGQAVSKNIAYGKKKHLNVRFADKTGSIQLTFFYYADQLAKKWQPGTTWRLFGQVSHYRNKLSMVHPESQLITPDFAVPLNEKLTPIYSNIQGISQQALRKLIQAALHAFKQAQYQEDDVFASSLAQYRFPSLYNAIEDVHNPDPQNGVASLNEQQTPAAQRLIAEELYAHYLVLQRQRWQAQKQRALTFDLSDKDLTNFLKQFPFQLTSGQQQCVKDIRKDLRQSHPMQRLVQGDVGSGKTLVAAIAALGVVKQDMQVAVMAPTELLAEQLAEHFRAWFEPICRVALLTGKLKAKEKRQIQENVLLGLDKIVIGTHALFQDKWQFKQLGLLIIDEQHRFGVSQRLSLQQRAQDSLDNGLTPHQLVMTATPIPRTLAMSRYAHMDISVINTLPQGRIPIQTFVISNQKRAQVLERILAKIKSQEQIYWVCTLIDESDVLNCQAAENTFQELCQQLPDVRIGLVHGRLEQNQKNHVMQDFKAGQIDLLVATTVIEVGVNVPNATLMVIENAERLGLAQLHQLRGRVGRADLPSHCILMYQAPLSQNAKARLNIMRQTCDGFKIAEADLQIRGPGEFLGVRQTGLAQYKMADILRDKAWFEQMPQLHKSLQTLDVVQQDEIIQRWIGNKEVYANA